MERPQAVIVHATLDSLRPTQMTVGRLEVQRKRSEWHGMSRKRRNALLDGHWFPAVKGPGKRHYIVDHHHLGLALAEENVKSVALVILQDYSWLEMETFWRTMEYQRWVHPFDARGVRRDFAELPKVLNALSDDVYRSVAGAVQRGGGFAKDVEPYSEFLWADYFRAKIKRKWATDDLDRAVKRALVLASSQDARYLPGWTGNSA